MYGIYLYPFFVLRLFTHCNVYLIIHYSLFIYIHLFIYIFAYI
jgi:hypothetical protein